MNQKSDTYHTPFNEMKLTQLREWVRDHQMDEDEQKVVLDTLVKKLDESKRPFSSGSKTKHLDKVNRILYFIAAFAIVYVALVTILSLT